MAPGSPLARLIASSGLSNLADGVFVVALPIVTIGITRDPNEVASVVIAQRLPWLLVALPAGALADRLDRRRTMALVNLARAALIGGLAAVVHQGWQELWMLYVLAFALGVGETFFDTAAQSVVPAVVRDPDALARANGRLYAVELTANQFLGPPLGGLLAGIAVAVSLGASAGAYLLAAGVLLLVAGSFRPERTGEPTTLRTDVVEGVRYLAGNRVLRTMALCTGLANLASTAWFAVLPLYVIDPGPMGLSEAGFGLLLTAGAVGAVLGSWAAGGVEARLGRTRSLVLAAAMFPVQLAAPAVTDSPWIVGGASVVTGATVIWNVITVSLRQRIAPDHLLGRVNAGYRLLAWGSMPLGAYAGGVLADAFGLVTTFWITAGVSALCIPLLLSGVSDAAIAAAEAEATGAGADSVEAGALT